MSVKNRDEILNGDFFDYDFSAIDISKDFAITVENSSDYELVWWWIYKHTKIDISSFGFQDWRKLTNVYIRDIENVVIRVTDGRASTVYSKDKKNFEPIYIFKETVKR